MLLGLVHVHGQFLLDHVALLADFHRVKHGVEKHVRQHVEQFVETIVARLGMEAGVFLAGEGVEIAADAFDRLGNFPGGTPSRALEEQVLDEMADAVSSPAHSARPRPPTAQAHAGHVRHLRRGDRQPVFETCDLIHFMQPVSGTLARSGTALGIISGGPTRRCNPESCRPPPAGRRSP